MLGWPILFSLLLQPLPSFTHVFYVSVTGIPGHGDGSLFNPWASLSEANTRVPDTGATVLVMDGTYDGRIHMNRRFVHHTVFKALNPYRAVLTHSSKTEQILTSTGGASFTIEGFEIKRPDASATGPLLMQVQKGKLKAEHIRIRNNIFHDSYQNDLLKINNGCSDVVVEGNVFYNQSGPDEHIDVNGVTDVIIQGNIFFNDFEGSKRRRSSNTNSFIVIKNSADLRKNENITIRRNVFLNWIGAKNNSFVLIGEDGKPDYEAKNVLVENNLMIGNSQTPMRSAFGVRGAKDVVFRNNTVTGDFPADAFAFSLVRNGQNPKNKNIRFYNNVWSDPTGTMGSFSEAAKADNKDMELDGNLYFNGGKNIPAGTGMLQADSDKHAIFGDPDLGEPSNILLPRWIPEQRSFMSDSHTIREEFERLVKLYGTPGSGSLAIDASNPQTTPADDILGNRRGRLPDMGACETNP